MSSLLIKAFVGIKTALIGVKKHLLKQCKHPSCNKKKEVLSSAPCLCACRVKRSSYCSEHCHIYLCDYKLCNEYKTNVNFNYCPLHECINSKYGCTNARKNIQSQLCESCVHNSYFENNYY